MLNVLIVEDDLSIAELLREGLEVEGYYVTGVARTVEDAMASAKKHHNDFAVIDINLARGGRGTEVAVRLRNIKRIGVIFSTGNDDKTLTLEQGDAVMIKPHRMRDVARGLKIIDEIGQFGCTDLPLPRNFRLLSAAVAA